MKILLFAGGSGTRFWPLSREKMPKQFIPIIGNQSTFANHIDYIHKEFGWENTYVQTTEALSALTKELAPDLPFRNIFTEPMRKDVAPAVGIAMIKMQKLGAGDEPVVIFWSDGHIKNTDTFLKSLHLAEDLINKDKNQIIFLGEKPRYPNENIGWLELGEKQIETSDFIVHKRKSFTYRPALKKATEWFEAKTHVWNPGYFIATPNFILEQFRVHSPKIFSQLETIKAALDTDEEVEVLNKVYEEIESISFDDAVLVKINNNLAKIIVGDYGWTDPGTLYALKEFLQANHEANVTKGKVYPLMTKDSLIYNLVDNQLVTTIGLDGFILINTPDAILACSKDQIPNIKKLLAELKDAKLEEYL